MPMSQTRLLRQIERRLGFKFTDLELSAEEIMEIITDETLPVFSKYIPYQIRVGMNRLVDGYNNRYWLDTDGLDVINVNKVVGLDGINLPGYSSTGSDAGMLGTGLIPKPAPIGGSGGNMFDGQYNADMSSLQSNPITFTFFPPSQIELSVQMANNTNQFIVEANVVHPSNLGTIPMNMMREFQDLAMADVAEAIIPMRTRFTNLQTSFGAIELNVDQLTQFVDARQEIIERMRTKVLNTGHRKKIYFV